MNTFPDSSQDGDLQSVTAARTRIARVIESTDRVGMLLVYALGPESLWHALSEHERPPQWLFHRLRSALEETGSSGRGIDLQQRFDAWRSRLPAVEPHIDARNAQSIGAWVVIPEDPDWPTGLDDLGINRPVALWGRGDRRRLAGVHRSVAVVGSRNATVYGAAVTREVSRTLVGAGWCVISGGAYGIDAAAHAAALTGGLDEPPTVAVMACGVDRFYPSANTQLLQRVEEHGLILSEVPLGCSPTRYRFLQRNRLIAALSQATVVTQAAWRSGSLNTAHHAEALSRAVAAVPGDVLGGASAGCHKLIREDHAVLVNNGAEVLELVGPLGNDAARLVHDRQDSSAQRPQDGLNPVQLRLYDALPLGRGADTSHLCRVSGLSPTEVLTGLAALSMMGLATDSPLGWRRLGSKHGPQSPP